jgi:hypothetical protein
MERRGLKVGLMVLIAGMAAFLAVGSAHADVFMKQKMHRDAFQMMGQSQPASDTVETTWMAADMMRHDGDKQSVIVRLDKKMAYFLDNAGKSYFEMPLDFEKAMASMGEGKGAQDKEMQEAMKAAQGMFKMKVSVLDTGEKKKVNNWNCRKYIREVTTGMGPVRSEVWATEDLKMDFDLYAQFSATMLARMPGAKEAVDQATAEMKKIKGVPVLTATTTNAMGSDMRSTEELLEFKEGKAPDGIFEVPAGYKKQSGPMGAPPTGRRSGPPPKGQ